MTTSGGSRGPDRLDHQIGRITVPLPFASEFYDPRALLNLVHKRLQARMAAGGGAAPAGLGFSLGFAASVQPRWVRRRSGDSRREHRPRGTGSGQLDTDSGHACLGPLGCTGVAIRAALHVAAKDAR